MKIPLPRKVLLLLVLLMGLVLARPEGEIELTVMNCGDQPAPDTAYYYAEIENTSSHGNPTIPGSILYYVVDENGATLCQECVDVPALKPGESYTDSTRSCSFNTIGDKTIYAEYWNSNSCTGRLLDSDNVSCYYIPTLSYPILILLVLSLTTIGIYWWKIK